MSKLKNIKAVSEMLEGKHKTQTKKTVSFDKKEVVRREVGDTWTDDKGQKWEQRNGYKVKVGKLAKLREELKSFPKCRKEVCTCTKPGSADLKMKAYHGMCLDCVIDMEHELKKSGNYEEYEQNKIRENAIAWLASAERDVKMLKQAYTESSKFVSSTNGDVETWSAKMTPDEFNDTVQKQFDKFKEEFLTNLNKKEINEIN